MKNIFSFLLLTVFALTAYAGKNKKAATVKQPAKTEQKVIMAQPASYWESDTRIARYMPVEIDSVTAAKYGATRPGQNNPYQFADSTQK